ncbi:LolA family protein [Sporolactobacillus vineae]|uniref:LolA family protein n=1 Tax=Sporolactobacillus vineae TaxID=444463 RepID=UPI000289F23A|nr:outer membrane lipoprotein carrier protein LolA [Sporolactobacillus vineae]
MNKKVVLLVLAMAIAAALLLTGCGAKTGKEVAKDLSNKVEKLNSYRTDATMTFQHNGKSQTYQANITFKKPYYYRVALTDSKNKNKQMILRNADGVFVLTPELNKSYQFESQWPNNRSQAYLYHSLNKDIQNDPDPSFSAKNNKYVFDTKTSYNTTQLANQSITLNKDLTPDQVQVKDKDQNVIVTVKFSHFQVNPPLDNKSFDVKQNMAAARIKGSLAASAENATFTVNYPTAKIAGTKLAAVKPEVTNTGEKYVLQYSGKKPFTLIETKSVPSLSIVSTLATGDPANLGFAIGASGDRTLSWSGGGTDYYLASDKLTQDEMVAVAQSVIGKITK